MKVKIIKLNKKQTDWLVGITSAFIISICALGASCLAVSLVRYL